ncbi:hypothetical protein DM01DRAFT_1322900 [Hesseltinella vesiculosa]|uniref:Mitochondrial import inner membrane translocase subunit n=1 Tax=Hesseltinella vesiculosa TaxID=101127 RepID=A0A1X2GGG5_9FUNG|nr:hypothetical protein DM01DRAFT_1322900 [Hesseltinella vesiculosa]
MSMWTSYSQAYVNPDNLVEAERQVDSFMSLIVEKCQKKCIPTHYREGDLNKGEMVCIDRCVAKYAAFERKLGEKLQEAYPNSIPSNQASAQPDPSLPSF